MKKRANRQQRFFEELKTIVRSLQHMKPEEVHIIQVRANYGTYQIVIGPESALAFNRHARPLEIRGEIPHLFMTPDQITPIPSNHQIAQHMKDTIIMRGLTVHILDEQGDGEHITRSDGESEAVKVREYINLAGDKGKKMLQKVESQGLLPKATYGIIQEDILHSLRTNPEKSLTDTTKEAE